VGHEIRQPLSYLGTSIDVLERELAGIDLPPEAKRSLENIRTATRRIAEIASSLAVLASPRPRTAGSLDVRRPIRAALDLCASQLASVDVERRLPDLPLVRGDEGELCQVFANLLLNAAHAVAAASSAPGASGARKTVSVTGGVVGDRV
jgi:C4-dicarboxylate-specific signal transduction histidine kinase